MAAWTAAGRSEHCRRCPLGVVGGVASQAAPVVIVWTLPKRCRHFLVALAARRGKQLRIRGGKGVTNRPRVVDAMAVDALGALLALRECFAVDAAFVECELVHDLLIVLGHESSVAVTSPAEVGSRSSRGAGAESGSFDLRAVHIVDRAVAAVAVRATEQILVMNVILGLEACAFLNQVAFVAKIGCINAAGEQQDHRSKNALFHNERK